MTVQTLSAPLSDSLSQDLRSCHASTTQLLTTSDCTAEPQCCTRARPVHRDDAAYSLQRVTTIDTSLDALFYKSRFAQPATSS
jgi:hypothetical protein